MHLEEYFEFLSPNEIRLKGHRVWVEHILYEYIFRERSPEQLAEDFDTLRLDQIYATVLYYLQHKEEMDQYMAAWLEEGRRALHEQRCQHPEWAARMKQLREEFAARKKRPQQVPA